MTWCFSKSSASRRGVWQCALPAPHRGETRRVTPSLAPGVFIIVKQRIGIFAQRLPAIPADVVTHSLFVVTCQWECIDIFFSRHYVYRMARNDIPKSFRFQPEELELLERLAGEYGSAKAAVMAGLRELEGKKEPSTAELFKMLKARLK